MKNFFKNYENNKNRFGRECAFLYICSDDNRRESRSPRDKAWLFKCCTHILNVHFLSA